VKKARVIITFQCPRMCDGCCNSNSTIMNTAKRIGTLAEISHYDDIVITGGEPLCDGKRALYIVRSLSKICKDTTRLFLYTSMYSESLPHIMPYLSGIKYTWHSKRLRKDYLHLLRMHKLMREWSLCSRRIAIDERERNVRHTAFVDKSAWDTVEWIDWDPDGNCPLPEGEELFIYTGAPEEVADEWTSKRSTSSGGRSCHSSKVL